MVDKKGFIWNMFGSIVYSLFSAIILAFCTRLNGLEISGIFSIAYATSCILNAIGEFGIRIFQTTDTDRKYKFCDYISARIFCVIFMIIGTFGIVIISGYTSFKLWICLLLVAYRIIDNISEAYQAEFQLQNRLDIGGKSVLYRNIFSICAFILIDILTKNIILSCFGMVFVNLAIFVFYDLRLIKLFINDRFKFRKKNAILIIKEVLPIAISSILNVYVINATKYAIDKVGNNVMQTYFNIIYMPTFAINLVSIFIIRPFLKPFAEYYNKNEYTKLKIITLKILVALIAVTMLIEIFCYIFGVPILNMLYSVNIDEYKFDLLILIISGMFYAISNLFFNLLSTIRKQKYITYTYLLIMVISYIVPNIFVSKMNMRGAVIANTIIMSALCFVLMFFYKIGISERRKEKYV